MLNVCAHVCACASTLHLRVGELHRDLPVVVADLRVAQLHRPLLLAGAAAAAGGVDGAALDEARVGDVVGTVHEFLVLLGHGLLRERAREHERENERKKTDKRTRIHENPA
jgi:hypothetical protein